MQATLAVATIIAIILGPIVALGIQRNSEKRREKRNRKLVIFKELMATRATTLSPRHVDALNAIEVEFSKGGGKGEKLVLDTWRLYLEHLNTSGTLSGDQLQRWGGTEARTSHRPDVRDVASASVRLRQSCPKEEYLLPSGAQ